MKPTIKIGLIISYAVILLAAAQGFCALAPISSARTVPSDDLSEWDALPSASLERLQLSADAGPQASGRMLDGAPPAKADLTVQEPDLAERARRIEDLHSEAVIKPRWLPKFIRDVPSYQLVEGPSADKEGFFQRAWRVVASPFIAPVGGMVDGGKQASTVAGDGGDTFGRVAGAVLGGLAGFIVGIPVGIAGAAVNAAMAIKNLFTGKI